MIVKIKGWRGAAAVATLMCAGLLTVSPVGSRACLFMQEFENSAKASGRVSLVERVIYSLVRAEQGAKTVEPS
jgi:hypothetical protein